MKQIIYLFAMLLGISFAACVEDTGNYSYENPDVVAPIIKSGIDENYSVLVLENLVIDPTIEGDESQYDYVWYAFPGTVTSSAPNDTLGVSKKLDCTISMEPGTYQLVFKVTDKSNGTSAFYKSKLVVASFFSEGYYILKYENGYTDVDFIDRNGELNVDILKTINGESLSGKPIRGTYEYNQYAYYVYDAEGNRTRKNLQPAYMICTDEDLGIYEGTSMKQLKRWNDAFLEVPAVKKPQGVWATTSGFMLMNNNAVHFAYLGGGGGGHFGYAYPNDDMQLNSMVTAGSSSCLCYDDRAGEFVGYYVQKHYPIKNAIESASPLSLKPVGEVYFTNCDLIYMGVQPYSSTSVGGTYAIVKDRTTGVASLWQINVGVMQNYYAVYDKGYRGLTIPASFDVVNGRVFAVQGYGVLSTPPAYSGVIYYSKGDNVVHYYNPSNQTEKKNMISIPADEEIVYLAHSSDPSTVTPVDVFSILSNKGGNWVLRTYNREGATPDINPKAVRTYTGNAVANNFIYRNSGTRITY